jgi:hypothetical protein
VDAAGKLTAERELYSPGLTPRRIAAGADGATRVLFSSEGGRGELLLLNSDNTLNSRHVFHP